MMADNDLEDAFEDDTKDIDQDNEWATLKAARHNDGYREGLTESKESSVQSGFNKGFEIGFSCMRQAAKLRGFLWVIIGTLKNSQTNVGELEKTQATEQFHDIIQALLSIEQETIAEIQKESKRDIDGTSKLPRTIDDATRLVDETVNSAIMKQQNELEKVKKLSIEILKQLRLADSFINKLNE